MLVQTSIYRFWKNRLARRWKRRRFRRILRASGCENAASLRVLEIGCANGQDVLAFLDPRWDVYGVDLKPQQIEGVVFTQCDAERLPFEDRFFDLVITVGLLEHIEPMEKLCRVIREIDRVGKRHVSVVPCVSTWLEPHTVKPLWPRFLHRKYTEKYGADTPLHLNFFSDHTWTKFEGFHRAEIRRFWYIFPLLRNLIIYKQEPE